MDFSVNFPRFDGIFLQEQCATLKSRNLPSLPFEYQIRCQYLDTTLMFSRMNGGLKAAFRARIDLFKNTLEKPIKSGKKVGGYQTKSLSLQSLQLMTNLATACQSLFTHHSHTHKVYFGKWILKFHIHH